jgi:hypothetical protein
MPSTRQPMIAFTSAHQDGVGSRRPVAGWRSRPEHWPRLWSRAARTQLGKLSATSKPSAPKRSVAAKLCAQPNFFKGTLKTRRSRRLSPLTPKAGSTPPWRRGHQGTPGARRPCRGARGLQPALWVRHEPRGPRRQPHRGAQAAAGRRRAHPLEGHPPGGRGGLGPIPTSPYLGAGGSWDAESRTPSSPLTLPGGPLTKRMGAAM